MKSQKSCTAIHPGKGHIRPLKNIHNIQSRNELDKILSQPETQGLCTLKWLKQEPASPHSLKLPYEQNHLVPKLLAQHQSQQSPPPIFTYILS